MPRNYSTRAQATYGKTQRNKSKVDKFKHYAVQRAILAGHSESEIMKMFNVNERNIVMAREKIKSRANKKTRKAKEEKAPKKKISNTTKLKSNQEMFDSLKKRELVRGITPSGVIVPSKECVRIIDERIAVLNKKALVQRKISLNDPSFVKRADANEELRIIQGEISALAPAVQGRLSKSNLYEFFNALQKLIK